MTLSEEEFYAITDRLEGWELVEFLQVNIEEVLASALDNDWINDENAEDLLEFAGLRK
jgi:hypothetical protein